MVGVLIMFFTVVICRFIIISIGGFIHHYWMIYYIMNVYNSVLKN